MIECPQRMEKEFWERLKKSGEDIDLRYARDLPDDTPEFILKMLARFEEDVSAFCFKEASGKVLDAGCGNGNLIMRALKHSGFAETSMSYVGMDFSRNMLCRAAFRADSIPGTRFSQGCINKLPFKDQSFDRVISSGVITCLPSVQEARDSLKEFNRVLRPGGHLFVDFFNQISHFTLVRKHLLREEIKPPEYVSPGSFFSEIEDAGFQVTDYKGFDFKPYQGYLFMSRWRPLIDPCFIQERLSMVIESKIEPKLPRIGLLGYRIYVKCKKM